MVCYLTAQWHSNFANILWRTSSATCCWSECLSFFFLEKTKTENLTFLKLDFLHSLKVSTSTTPCCTTEDSAICAWSLATGESLISCFIWKGSLSSRQAFLFQTARILTGCNVEDVKAVKKQDRQKTCEVWFSFMKSQMSVPPQTFKEPFNSVNIWTWIILSGHTKLDCLSLG